VQVVPAIDMRRVHLPLLPPERNEMVLPFAVDQLS
jgi:hypothetical protein